MEMKEIKAHKWFRLHPHRHIVQGMCHFHSHPTTVVLIQKYIPNGDTPREWTVALWKSVVLQLTYVCFEFYDMGFYFRSWHFGNILLDTTDDTEVEYTVFNEKIKVATEGVCPVLTDFARSLFYKTRSLECLTDDLGILWSLLTYKCPVNDWKPWFHEKSIEIGYCNFKEDILRVIHTVQTFLEEHT
jgi:hypothetical protein